MQLAPPAVPSSVDLLADHPAYAPALARIAATRRRWLVTGGAGFIGSHLVESLLSLGQDVVVLDDCSTGTEANLEVVRAGVGADAARRLAFVRGDLRDAAAVAHAAAGAAVVLHHAALVSVPLSIEQPIAAHEINTTGFLHVLEAARAQRARVVYAASSASYGDDPADVKVEGRIGRPLSMYAATKTANETYASAYGQAYGLETVGLRYFNVFGARQDPNGAYAAVIPNWIATLARGGSCRIHGDGLTTRDFCHVANVVGANLLAATAPAAGIVGEVFNVGTGRRTTLLELFDAVVEALREALPQRADLGPVAPEFGPFRPGDVRHSCADVSHARDRLGFVPVVDLREGIGATLGWFLPR
jgi:UDP-N-acetylglucosamine/UDP-N-acetylgalactosamine 4-epimerase